MTVEFPVYCAGIIRHLCRDHGTDSGEASKLVSDYHVVVWERYGRNTPEATVAEELRRISTRNRRRPADTP